VSNLKYLEFNNKRIGPLDSEILTFLNTKVDLFDDLDVLGNQIYIEHENIKYLFDVKDIKSYEFEKVIKVPALNNKTRYSLILDVGCSYGGFSISNANKNTKFISVEYDTKLYSNFLKNIELNKKNGLIQPIFISENLESNNIASKNIRNITELRQIINILGFENIDLIRFDSRINNALIEKFLSKYEKNQIPNYIISHNKFINFKNGKIT
tara:strand:+ start:26063 stop:26695 length:633 start_codon:yes stop_codon:yes gene_type:complete